MLRFSLLLCAALLWPTTADAAEVIVGITAAFAKLGPFAQFFVRLGASLLLNVVAMALLPGAPPQKRELQIPMSRPPKRFVYGHNRTYGSPAPWRVKGAVLYGCLILNSRPSHGGTIDIYMDKRRVTSRSGSIHDFSGNGAILETIEDFPTFGPGSLRNPRVWIGLGGQTTPPVTFTTEAPEFFQTTDGWQGCTVMWIRLDVGPRGGRAPRWRAAPPEFEVEMDWSRVWDMRDEDQDPDDASTWTFSKNQALCLLDALRENPIRRYPLAQLHLPSFEEAADVADEQVLLHYATIDAGDDVFESRYTASGVVIWKDGELVDQVTPLVEAGGGNLVRIGGRVGYAAGEYRAPLLTVTDFIEDGGIDYQVLKPGRELPPFVRGVYIAPDRDWQEAELEPLGVVGADNLAVGDEAVLELRLPFVTSPTQAMRLQQITARRLAAQRSLSVTLWPEAMDVVAGATVEMDLPPIFARLNGTWSVTSANPALWISEAREDGEQQIALRIPVTMQEVSASIYAWNPATDEQEVLGVTFDPARPSLTAPANLAVASGDGISTESAARLQVSFDDVPGADEYEIEIRAAGQAYVRVAVATVTPGASSETVYIDAALGLTYDVQVRAVARPVAGSVRYSDYSEVTGVQAFPDGYDLDIPTSGTATGGANQITVSFTAPSSRNYRGIEFWVAETDNIGAATLLTSIYDASPGVKTYIHTGLGNGVTRYYFARSAGDFGFFSAYTASVNATTDP